MTTAKPKPRRPRVSHAKPYQVAIPPATNLMDYVVDALMRMWRDMDSDLTAQVFFNTPLALQRQQIVAHSVDRYVDEIDRALVARCLKDLADAIYGGTWRWVGR